MSDLAAEKLRTSKNDLKAVIKDVPNYEIISNERYHLLLQYVPIEVR